MKPDATSPIQSGLVYFAWVFGTGFALGVVRVPWLVPRLGVRAAELLEMPFMLVAIILAARSVVRRFRLRTLKARMATGLLALALLLASELMLSWALRGASLRATLAQRDPVSGGVYLAMLGLFATWPCLVGREVSLPPE